MAERSDSRPRAGHPTTRVPAWPGHLVQELRELGLSGTLYRARREARLRVGLAALLDRGAPPGEAVLGAAFNDDGIMGEWAARVPFGAPADVAALRPWITEDRLAGLGVRVRDEARGRIVCFGRWVGDYCNPIDWHVNPTNGRRWDPHVHWSQALRQQSYVGDVKLTWEVGRFPQAYDFVRAATFGLCPVVDAADALDRQIRSFVSCNPFPNGVHWNSGQEIAFRLVAFVFSVGAMVRLGAPVGGLPAFVSRAATTMAHHVASQIDFAERAIYNNHLLSEAAGLLISAWLLPPSDVTARWASIGRRQLDEQADRQIYRDGAYIQQSHNYHRVAVQDYLIASRFLGPAGAAVPARWSRAMERSLEFLVSHQCPTDGRLPNYGANDGALPASLSACDFSDFRPTLQALSVAVRGERLYEPGPWDEEAAWLFGRRAVEDARLRPPTRRSVAFRDTGYHVLRGRDPRSFASFRCGSIKDRFSQIDMLHVDVFWRGHNVLVDAGSYVYNANEAWHAHFLRTESHNTVQVDGLDQMLHFRQFKCLYWTQAKLLSFEDAGGIALVAGEHTGFRRHPGGCVHRRSVLFVKDDLWIVVDRISGTGTHDVRLHWLGGAFPHAFASAEGRVTLSTPEGPFSVTVVDDGGRPLPGTVVAGRDAPPRGWLSRYYFEKVPVPSLAVERSGPTPMTLVSVLAAGTPEIDVREGVWSVRAGAPGATFKIEDGMIRVEDAWGDSR